MRVSTLSGVVMDGGMSVVIFMRGAARASTFVCAVADAVADITSEPTPSLNASRRFMIGTPFERGILSAAYSRGSAKTLIRIKWEPERTHGASGRGAMSALGQKRTMKRYSEGAW